MLISNVRFCLVKSMIEPALVLYNFIFGKTAFSYFMRGGVLIQGEALNQGNTVLHEPNNKLL